MPSYVARITSICLSIGLSLCVSVFCVMRVHDEFFSFHSQHSKQATHTPTHSPSSSRSLNSFVYKYMYRYLKQCVCVCVRIRILHSLSLHILTETHPHSTYAGFYLSFPLRTPKIYIQIYRCGLASRNTRSSYVHNITQHSVVRSFLRRIWYIHRKSKREKVFNTSRFSSLCAKIPIFVSPLSIPPPRIYFRMDRNRI